MKHSLDQGNKPFHRNDEHSISSTDVNNNPIMNSGHCYFRSSSDFESNHDNIDFEVTTSHSRRIIHYHEGMRPNLCSTSNDLEDENFRNGNENYLENLSGRFDSLTNGDMNKQSRLFTASDEEYTAAHTTEAILTEIFGKNSGISEQKYTNGNAFRLQNTTETYNGLKDRISRRNPSIDLKHRNLRNENISNANNDALSTIKERKNGEYSRNGGITNNSKFKTDLKEIPHGGEAFDRSDSLLKRYDERYPIINVVNQLESIDGYGTLENSKKYTTFKDIPLKKSESFDKTRATESLLRIDPVKNTNTSVRSTDDASAKKKSKHMTTRSSAFHSTPLIQSNVVDFYEKLNGEGKFESLRDTRITERTTPRKGFRSKSSETPLKYNLSISPSRLAIE